MNRYRDIILSKDFLAKDFDEKEKHILKFFVGKSYFELKDYKKAAFELKSLLVEKDNGKNNKARGFKWKLLAFKKAI